MTAFCGCAGPGADPAVDARLAALRAALDRGGWHLGESLSGGGVGIYTYVADAGCESDAQSAAVTIDDGSAIGFAGRIDAYRGQRISSPMLFSHDLFRAVMREGVAAYDAVVGDIRLALWDASSQRVMLFTDALGRYPLYYSLVRGVVYWSSSARSLAIAVQGSSEVNLEYVADFLANQAPFVGPFAGVHVVPPAHAVVFDGRSVLTRRYWYPRLAHEERIADDGTYVEDFLRLFDVAVGDRTARNRPTYCELSGGLDSSTIACTADRIAASRGMPPVRTVSHLFMGDAATDEVPHIREVEAWIGRRGLHFRDDHYPPLAPLPDSFEPDIPTGGLVYYAIDSAVAGRMRADGATVLLSGLGGDQLFWSTHDPGLPVGDLVFAGQYRMAFRALTEWSLELRLPLVRLLWSGVIRPRTPRWFQARTRYGIRLGEWFRPDFIRRYNVRERMLPLPDDLGLSPPSRSVQYGYIRRSMRPYALDWVTANHKVDVRYPYLDRRLVEFVLSIPLDQKLRVGESRSLVRRAFTNRLPESVRTRVTKGSPAQAFHRALVTHREYVDHLLQDARVYALGVADESSLRSAVARARHGVVSNQSQLKSTLALEMWLRSLDACPRAGDSVPPGRRRTVLVGGTDEDHTYVPAAGGH